MRLEFGGRMAGVIALGAWIVSMAGAQNPGQQPGPLRLPAPPVAGDRTLVPPVRPFRLPPRIGVFGEAQLSLAQALSMALSNNKDIESSRIDREEVDYTLLGAQGVYDPTVSGSSYWQKQVQPIASSLGGSATGSVLNKTWNGDPTLAGSVPWLGGSYRADYSNQRVYTNNTFVTLNPQYPTAVNLQYTQPLLRNLRYDSNRHAIDVAKKNRFLTDEQFRQRVMQIVQQTEQAYWELVYAYNNLQVQLEAVEIAQQQDASNRRQQEQGILAPIDVVAAQTQLANFELGAYSSQTALTRAENNLKTLVLADRSSAMWASAVIPTTPPSTEVPVTPLTDALRDALTSRPEAAQNRIAGQIAKDDTRYYRDQTKPQVDLIAQYSRAGLAGAQIPTGPNPFLLAFAPLFERVNDLSATAGLGPLAAASFGSGTTPQLLIGSYGQSVSNIWNGAFPTTEFQLRISLPIRNRAAEANLSRAVAEERRNKNQREQVQQTIEADVRNSMQGLQSAQASLEAARVARESAEQQYQSEQRQFQAGTSTLFLVQQRQSTMITARSQERRAQSDLSEAIASFELATASILKAHKISLQ